MKSLNRTRTETFFKETPLQQVRNFHLQEAAAFKLKHAWVDRMITKAKALGGTVDTIMDEIIVELPEISIDEFKRWMKENNP